MTLADFIDGDASLAPLVQPWVRQASLPVIYAALRAMARQFMVDTEIWREELDAFPTVADQAAYPLALPTEGTDPDTVTYNATFKRALYVRLNSAICTLDPCRWTLRNDGVLTFKTAPATTDLPVVVGVVFTPNASCTQLPAALVARWGPAIAEGAIAYLLTQDSQPWSNPNEGARRMQAYVYEVNNAKREVCTSCQSGELSIRIPDFI